MRETKASSAQGGTAKLSALAMTGIEHGVSPSQVEMIGRAFLKAAEEMRAAGIEDTAHGGLGHA